MKRFVFTLGRIMEYKEQVLKTQKAKLAALSEVLNGLTSSKKEILAQISSANESGRGAPGEVVTTFGLLANRNYIEGLRSEVTLLTSQIIAQENLVERQVREVVAAQREISSMEKLREKQYQEYGKKLAKEEELFIEEFVSGAKYRKEHQN